MAIHQWISRKADRQAEINLSVESFIMGLCEKELIPDVESFDEIKAKLEDFVMDMMEDTRAALVKELRERIETQISEAEI